MLPELNAALTAALENAVNGYLHLAPESLSRLGRLQGKVIAMELRGLKQTFYFLPDPQGLLIQGHYEGEADATLSGTPLAFAELSLSNHPNRVLFRGDVQISGDIKLGQQFKHILDELEVDWEEVLSHYTGDVVAHKVGDLWHGVDRWGKHALATLGQNGAEYLQQETFDLPFKDEARSFIGDVNQLRDDVERLAARVARLQQQLTNDG